MGIVIITIPGEAKRTFVNSLHKKTGGKVDLVIIQKPKPHNHSIISNLKRLYNSVGLKALPIEIWYAILLRLNRSAKNTLEYFREHSLSDSSQSGYLPKTMEVTSINDNDVFETLTKLSPDLMVIWGGTIIKPQIIKTAKKAINLHMGFCPYYLGAIANQHAVINREPWRIGATIHYAEAKVDTGDIIEIITPNLSKPPRELFRDLNDRAKRKYLKVIKRLYEGQILGKRPQKTKESQKLTLKEWTPRIRYRLAKQMVKWERTGKLA